ncbi:hypothetical protein HED22_10085 [Thalassospira sp. HF15]|uniref:hypothetical protein n=1 Tax=Thalassospira sp. HF15 TaxID=2722755 RepID=UPI001431160F|nr:hypothetical protein [Thalassospira sp. HF15]NIY75993.1 hypothetical protein [Thalassospira sp. HF15]
MNNFNGPTGDNLDIPSHKKRKNRVHKFIAAAFISASLAGCATPSDELSKVARDWSMTIRASQIIPVYPLTEDVQPGDIFLVPVPISEQAAAYEEDGFLPIDQHVERLSNLNYSDFYQDGFWKGVYANVPHEKPTESGDVVLAPRAAFPSYSFDIERQGGLKLALPIQGIPVGMGFLNADSASATVTIDDAFTYGVSSAEIYRRLIGWHATDPAIKETLRMMVSASQTEDGQPSELYFRVVTRVYQTRKLDVTIMNNGSTAAGLDVGISKLLKPETLETFTTDQLNGKLDSYKAVLDSLSEPLNVNSTGVGGSATFTQVTARTVSLKQEFAVPLTIGFVGFDVKVESDGSLSTPIPSFSVINGNVSSQNFAEGRKISNTTEADDYLKWLSKPGNRAKALEFTEALPFPVDPTDLLFPEYDLILKEFLAANPGITQ